MRRRVAVAVVVWVAILLGLVLVGHGRSSEPAMTLTAKSLTEQRAEVQVLPAAQARPTVLVFFASWCNKCWSELVNAQWAHVRVGDRVQFIGVNFSDDRGMALDLIKQAEVKFPTVADTSGAIARKFGVVGMPTTVFVNAAGRVIARKHGFDPVMVDEVRRYFGVTPTDSS